MEEGKEMQRQRGFLHFYDTEMEQDPMVLVLPGLLLALSVEKL